MSVELATIYQGVKTGVSIVKIVLRYLDNSFDSLFREIAEVHYTSVRQAFADAERMNDVERRNFEIQVARVHLRDTFNAYQHFLNRKGKYFRPLLAPIRRPAHYQGALRSRRLLL